LEAQETVPVMIQIMSQDVPEPIYCLNLKKAGLTKPCKFYFMRDEADTGYQFVTNEQLVEGRDSFAAYTLSELKAMLPNFFMTGRVNTATVGSVMPDLQYTCYNAVDQQEEFPHMNDPHREANAAAMMLLWLLSEGRVKPDVPQRMFEKKKVIQLHQM
jgi:hypothetical protein